MTPEALAEIEARAARNHVDCAAVDIPAMAEALRAAWKREDALRQTCEQAADAITDWTLGAQQDRTDMVQMCASVEYRDAIRAALKARQ